MYFKKEERLSMNISSAKAIHIATLVTEWLLESKQFDFVEQKIVFSLPRKEDVFGTIRTTKQAKVTLIVIFKELQVDLNFGFTLERDDKWNNDKRWGVQYGNIVINSSRLDSQIWIREARYSNGTIEFEVLSAYPDLPRLETFKRGIFNAVVNVK